MVNIFKLAEKISSSFESLHIDSTKCSKVRSHMSNCSKCLDICPSESIHIDEDSISIDPCINCGLCTMKCPTGALSMKNPSIDSLLSKIKYYSKQTEYVYIHCAEHRPTCKNVTMIQVPCLGSIHKELWMLLLKSSTTFEVFLPKDGCEACKVAGGMDIFMHEFEDAKEIIQQEMNFIDSEDQIKRNQIIIDTNKREWLNSMFSFAKQAPVKAIDNWTSDVTDEAETEQLKRDALISPKRKLLGTFIKKYPTEAKKITIKYPVINENCELCKACSLLCPNQALTQTDNNRVVVDPLMCSECYLCQDICYFEAIDFIETEAECLLAK